MIIAVVIKHADNIVKTFATAFSLVLSCVFSHLLFRMQLGLPFLGGVGIVVLSTHVFGNGSEFINNHRLFRWMNVEMQPIPLMGGLRTSDLEDQQKESLEEPGEDRTK
eukprot:TRINITY_DN10571_c0_g1_i1.p1 TRINITY_DN10571_c0_g1~~TRINITY_DN10571_c0_g1_i1.p1  ORF type:complete len:108 (-),score=23.42 TRINITY_DN10571_c0_g1_i1:142-465(-)